MGSRGDKTMAHQSSGYQSLGNGVYRVNGAVRRSAVTGLFESAAARNPQSSRAVVRDPRAEVAARAERKR